MTKHSQIRIVLLGTACFAGLGSAALAESFNVPEGDLRAALSAYSSQAHVQLMVSDEAVKGARSAGATGDFSADTALSRILKGTGFSAHRISSGAIGIVPDATQSSVESETSAVQLAQASTGARGAVETVTVTSSKLGGADVQSVPIAISAFSQEQLTATQTTGGPDLVKVVPNLTFTKTNFSGYSIQIRGIGTQAVSVATDPAVAVSFNDTPFIRNHFFEQEFFDVSQVQVLRGPQGTLYGRNATAGVVNVVSAKPSDHYEALASVDVGNYNNRRLEGMLNIPVFEDKVGLRLAGEWTKRDGYDYNLTTEHAVNGRDLWSGRATLALNPTSWLHSNVIWEHFQEDDNRSRTGKQLCHHDAGPDSVGSVTNLDNMARGVLSQGCLPGSLYDKGAFGTPNGIALNFVLAAEGEQTGRLGYKIGTFDEVDILQRGVDPYGNMMQSTNLREIASIRDPKFRSKNDTLEFNTDIQVSPGLTITSLTGYNKDTYYSTQDYNRFNTVPIFNSSDGLETGWPYTGLEDPITPGGIYCDPQIGCSNTIAGFDISEAKSWQFSQELRLTSNFDGPFNFSVGANYLHYHTVENYYVIFNVLSALAQSFSIIGNNSANLDTCFRDALGQVPITSPDGAGCLYIDPNPIDKIDGEGHNYFRSKNPYTVNSWAGFGEVYYKVSPNVKLTAGLRYTDDNKTFTPVPTQLLLSSGFYQGGTVDRGYPSLPDIKQHWGEVTGRLNAEWTPKVDFTEQTLVYASYSRGYKGGGANPPGIGYSTEPLFNDRAWNQVLPYSPTFKPEFVNAYELGTKNTLLDGAMTLNGGVFYYDYKDYQISMIRSRTAVNDNFDAKVWGTEVEASWEPMPGLRFNFAGGYEGSRLDKNQYSIDPMDRLNGHTDYMVVKPWVQLPDNCVVKKSVVEQYIALNRSTYFNDDYIQLNSLCPGALFPNLFRYPDATPDMTTNSPTWPFDEDVLPNQGQGFYKNVGGNELPNTPPFTLSAGAQFSMPISADWVGTLRGDFYWQGNSFARIFNDKPYDQLHGYSNVNMTLIFTNQDGWQAMAYIKNVFDKTALTGAFLNSDDTGLTTNVFTTDPRLFGIRLTKNW